MLRNFVIIFHITIPIISERNVVEKDTAEKQKSLKIYQRISVPTCRIFVCLSPGTFAYHSGTTGRVFMKLDSVITNITNLYVW